MDADGFRGRSAEGIGLYNLSGFQKPESSFIWNITEDDGLSIGICQQANIRVPNEEDWKENIYINILVSLTLHKCSLTPPPCGHLPSRGGLNPHPLSHPPMACPIDLTFRLKFAIMKAKVIVSHDFLIYVEGTNKQPNTRPTASYHR